MAKLSYDMAALGILLSDDSENVRQARLVQLFRRAQREARNEFACPACGHEGPHDDNGARRADLSFCCCACGEHFDAEVV